MSLSQDSINPNITWFTRWKETNGHVPGIVVGELYSIYCTCGWSYVWQEEDSEGDIWGEFFDHTSFRYQLQEKIKEVNG